MPNTDSTFRSSRQATRGDQGGSVAHSHPRHRRRRDEGSTLTEVVIAVVLLAVVVVPVLGGVAMATKASSRARAAANVETALVNAVDRINRAPYDRCDYQQYARAAVVTQGWSENEVTTQHFYLDTTTGLWASGPANAAACPNGTHRNGTIKKVIITVTDPKGTVSRSLEVVKSDV